MKTFDRMSNDKKSDPARSSNKSRRTFLKVAAGGIGVIAIAAIAGTYYENSSRPPKTPTSFKLGSSAALPTDVTLYAAQTQNFFAKNGLDPSYVPFSDLQVAMNAFIGNQFEFHWDSNIPASANARAKGAKVQGIYGATPASNTILVKKDSPYQTIADLKGKTVGTFLLPSLTFIIASESWNKDHASATIDPLKDFSYSQGAPPILNQNLLSGQLDAVETIEPFVSLGLTSGARQLTGAFDSWKFLTGGTIFGAIIGAQEDNASAHPEIAKAVIQTWNDGSNYVRTHPDFFNNFVKTTYNFTNQSLIDSLRERWNGSTPTVHQSPATDWNDSVISNLNQFLQLLQKYKIVDTVPTGLFTTRYNP